jgi:hypothetical protein
MSQFLKTTVGVFVPVALFTVEETVTFRFSNMTVPYQLPPVTVKLVLPPSPRMMTCLLEAIVMFGSV